MKRIIGGLAALTLFSASFAADAKDPLPIPSSADAFEVFGEVEGWTVYADKSLGTCLIEKSDTFGNVVQMGLTKDHAYGYMGLFTLADIEVKKSQEIAVLVDGAVFVGEAHGIKSSKIAGDYSGGYFLTDNPDLVTAIAEGHEMVAFPEKAGAFVVDLTGTKRAIEEARKCNASLAG